MLRVIVFAMVLVTASFACEEFALELPGDFEYPCVDSITREYGAWGNYLKKEKGFIRGQLAVEVSYEDTGSKYDQAYVSLVSIKSQDKKRYPAYYRSYGFYRGYLVGVSNYSDCTYKSYLRGVVTAIRNINPGCIHE